MKKNISWEKLHMLLSYAPETGKFTWKVNRCGGAIAGQNAGSINSKGYLSICIDNERYLAHRLAWFYVNKKWPLSQIDHINREKSDNKIKNLREVVCSENMQNKAMHPNNTSGYRGVDWHKQSGKWRARIGVMGKQKNLGMFATAEEAYKAYKSAVKQFHTCNPEALEA